MAGLAATPGAWGMDAAAVANLAVALRDGGETCAEVRRSVLLALAIAPWRGADEVRFRAALDHDAAPRLAALESALRIAADRARSDADEQIAASGVAGPAGAPLAGASAPDRPAPGPPPPADRGSPSPAEVSDWPAVGPSGVDPSAIATSLLGRALATASAWRGTQEQIDHLVELATATTNPDVSEYLAAGILVAGSGANLLVTAAGGKNAHRFDDGRLGRVAEVADPLVPPNVAHDGSPPRRLADLFDMTEAAGQIRPQDPPNPRTEAHVSISTIDGPHGPAHIVTIPGTEHLLDGADSFGGIGSPSDNVSNLVLSSGRLSVAAEGVAESMRQAGIGPDDPVLLVGHSQGGMIATRLAEDAGFRANFRGASNVVTYGSPVDAVAATPGIATLAVQHEEDPVPRADLGGIPDPVRESGARVVTRPAPVGGSPFLPTWTHDYAAYRLTAVTLESDPGVRAFLDSRAMEPFLTGADRPGRRDFVMSRTYGDGSP